MAKTSGQFQGPHETRQLAPLRVRLVVFGVMVIVALLAIRVIDAHVMANLVGG